MPQGVDTDEACPIDARAGGNAVMQATAFVALGSNMGDRWATLCSAVDRLHASVGIEVSRSSSVYETKPVGPSTAPFLNAAVHVLVELHPIDVLRCLHQIEQEHGRERRIRWDARTLDLDLLLYLPAGCSQSLELDEPACRIPHPAMLERDFVLAPLADLEPALIVAGRSIEDHLDALAQEVRTIERRLDPLPQPS